MRDRTFQVFFVICFVLYFVPSGVGLGAERVNVLFIAVDDLRPQFGAYGQSEMITPHIDRLAGEGVLFRNAYCQAAVCRASRASLMLGLRPDSTEVWSNGSKHKHSRDHLPDVITLPQHFKNEGYHTQSLGKIFHGAFAVRNLWNDVRSWSVDAYWPGPQYYYTDEGIRIAREVYAKKIKAKRSDDPAIDEWKNQFVLGLSHEAPDVSDGTLYDGQIAAKGIEVLRGLKTNQPFFLAMGFIRPHLPFIAPKKYWDMYPPGSIEIASNLESPQDFEPVAMTSWGHARTYTDFPAKGDPSLELTRKLTRGYAACVTYVDAQIGRVLAELEVLGLKEKTVVVLWGDHGWHIGENHIWGKATNFELSARVPLIVFDPRVESATHETRALVELVDLYPTLCELAGLEKPAHLEGTSFAPLLADPKLKWKSAAFSQITNKGSMGRSIRTRRYRFTRWTKISDSSVVTGLELYDQQSDPQENVNLAKRGEYAELVGELEARLEANWRGALPSGE